MKIELGNISRRMNTTEQGNYDAVLFIARSNPVTNAHVENVRRGAELARIVVIAKGSAYRPRTSKNPFTDGEVEQMWRDAFQYEPHILDKLRFIRIRDYNDNKRWCSVVESEFYKTLASRNLTKSDARVAIIGHTKDESSFYLRYFPDFDRVELPNFQGLSATDVRKLYFDADNLANHWGMLATMLPAGSVERMRVFASTPQYEILVREHRKVLETVAREAKFPYDVITNCADVIIQCQDRVLMGRRKGDYGYGLLAFPGGIMEKGETFLQCAMREGFEEVTLPYTKEYLVEHFLWDKEVFDSVNRSHNGRRVTYAYFFDMGDHPIPEVEGQDDLGDAQWIRIADLVSLETEIFEDHLAMADRFLNIL